MTFWATKKGDEVPELLTLALQHYRTEKEEFLLKIDSNVPKFKELNKFPEKSKYSIGESSLSYQADSWFKNKSYYSGTQDISNSTALEARKKLAGEVVDKYIADYTEVYNSNLEVIDHNKLVVEKITALMQAIGIPNSYNESYYKTARSRTRTSETKKAGYLHDIDRNIKTSQPSIPKKEDLLSGCERYYSTLLSKIVVEEGKAERARKAQEEMHSIALLRAKYTPDDAMSGAWELLEGILAKDKYLRLAYYLEQNRNDWSDGYDYAESGLNGFTVEDGNSLDKDIYDCISECIDSGNNGDIDGRIFRDCEYNYNVLYGYVTDANLLTDLEKVKSWSDDD